MFKPGLRVIHESYRTRDDEGEFYGVGTVSEIVKSGTRRSSDMTVLVKWDCGDLSIYQGSYDLTILDNAQCGITHLHVRCDACQRNGITGFRFKCTICYDYDVCFLCYHNNMHDLEHIFARYDTPESSGVKLSPRNVEVRVHVKGIFKGAVVRLGDDWEWDTTGTGEDGEGIVREIYDERWRSMARVAWHKLVRGSYSVGLHGKMDLKYVKPASGGQYYIKHLPIFSHYAAGDRVKVVQDAKTLQILQQENGGGWNPRMAECIGKVGIVHDHPNGGDVEIKYAGYTQSWTFHPGALERVGGNRARRPLPPPPTKKKVIRSETSSVRDDASGNVSSRAGSIVSDFAGIWLDDERVAFSGPDNVNQLNLNQQNQLGYTEPWTRVFGNRAGPPLPPARAMQHQLQPVIRGETSSVRDDASGNVSSRAGSIVSHFAGIRLDDERVAFLDPDNDNQLNLNQQNQLGVEHRNVVCDSCNQNGIIGIRYKCAICYDYDLCSRCYHNNKHMEHTFTRYDTPESSGEKVSRRNVNENKGVKTMLKGKVVDHPNVTCDSCNQIGVIGIRYKCNICVNYDLCSSCYNNNQHNLKHTFTRYDDTPGSRGVKLSPRNEVEENSHNDFFTFKSKENVPSSSEVPGMSPAMKERIDLARAISRSLAESSNQINKEQSMFVNQQKRSIEWVHKDKEPPVTKERGTQPSAEQLRSLKSKIQEMEEKQICSICMERERSVAFLCGHQACTDCAAKLDTCHMCRKRITTRIKLH